MAAMIKRHNIFAKRPNAATGAWVRSNVLVGHVPSVGAGAEDTYLTYGNFLYGNPTQAHFQDEGNIACNSNVLVNPAGSAAHLQSHNAMPTRVDFSFNAAVVRDTGIQVAGGIPTKCQRVWRNMVFAATRLENGEQIVNVHGSFDESTRHLAHLFCALCVLDLTLKRTQPSAPLMSEVLAAAYPDAEFDFNGHRRTLSFAGAYAARRPAWQLALAHKPLPLSRR